ncbi:hypothetical protein PIROE2DRAFT_9354, partial [Piromyces sp. E2]
GSGDVIDKLGDYQSHYFANGSVMDDKGNWITTCSNNVYFTEMHPFRWFFTRQIGTVCWYFGEMIADWYPLIRTKAVTKDRSIWYVYLSCGLFNLAKLTLILYHFTLRPDKLYDVNGAFNGQLVNDFYFTYWIIQLSIIYTSLIYDFTVFFVLKRELNEMGHADFGFLKKFRSVSEFRILISIIISIAFLPICSITIILKFYYRNKKGFQNLDFTFEDIRTLIANVQYYMIFIDQLLLLHLKNESSINTTNASSFNKSNNNVKLNHNYSCNTNFSNNNYSYNNNFSNNNYSNNAFSNNNYSNNDKSNNMINNNYSNNDKSNNMSNNNYSNNNYKLNSSSIYYENLSNLNSNKELDDKSTSNLLENDFSIDTSITITVPNINNNNLSFNNMNSYAPSNLSNRSRTSNYHEDSSTDLINVSSYSNNYQNNNSNENYQF